MNLSKITNKNYKFILFTFYLQLAMIPESIFNRVVIFFWRIIFRFRYFIMTFWRLFFIFTFNEKQFLTQFFWFFRRLFWRLLIINIVIIWFNVLFTNIWIVGFNNSRFFLKFCWRIFFTFFVSKFNLKKYKYHKT